MTAMAASLLIALMAGQMPPMPGGAGEEAPAPPKLHVVAAHASNTGQEPASVDEALARVKKVLEALPFDTYTPVADQEVEAPLGEETLVPLNGIYSLYVVPQGQDETGALMLTARISMLTDKAGPEEYIDAIYTEAKLASGMPLVFRGLDLNVGELVMVLSLSGDNKEKGQSQQDESEQQEEEEDKDSKEDQESGKDNENDQQQQDPQEQEPQDSASAQEQEDSPDLQNIEALLQSLEETDRKEQEEQQRRRTGIRVRGDWW